jgi:hypothetical protein
MKSLALVLAALVLGVCVTSVRADGIDDPTIKVQKVDPADPTTFSTNSATDPLFVADDLNDVNAYQYTGSGPLDSLFVEIEAPIVPGLYTCESNTFMTCGELVGPPASGYGPVVSGDIEFEFTDGELLPGDVFTVTVAPEPSSILLLVLGLGSLLMCMGLRRKFLNAPQAA